MVPTIVTSIRALDGASVDQYPQALNGQQANNSITLKITVVFAGKLERVNTISRNYSFSMEQFSKSSGMNDIIY